MSRCGGETKLTVVFPTKFGFLVSPVDWTMHSLIWSVRDRDENGIRYRPRDAITALIHETSSWSCSVKR